MRVRSPCRVSVLSSLVWVGCAGDGSVPTVDGGAADGGREASRRPFDGGVTADSRPSESGPGDARANRDATATDAARNDGGSDAARASNAIPRITSDFWTVAHNPDLGAVGAPGQQVVDFSVWQAGDGTWQLWSCIRATAVGGNTRLFYHWQGRTLTDLDWEPLGIAMQADPSLGETAGGIQAPFVIRLGDVWHMFYGDWEHICHATSSDGKAFTRIVGGDGKTGLFTEGIGLNTRDPMLLHEGTTNYLYYTASDGADYVRTSSDLTTFGPSTRVAFGGSAGTNGSTAECPFVVHPEPSGPYFLFRTQNYGGGATTHVYRSMDPKNFGIDDDAHFLVETLPLAAPEIIHVGADYYIATLRGDLAGIQIAHLTFAP